MKTLCTAKESMDKEKSQPTEGKGTMDRAKTQPIDREETMDRTKAQPTEGQILSSSPSLNRQLISRIFKESKNNN